MRKDSWYRGALLSVLFFFLLWGGAPTLATADLWWTSASSSEAEYEEVMRADCEAGGGEWIGSGVAGRCDYTALAEHCERLRRERTDAGVLAAAGGLLAMVPWFQGIGIVIGGIGAWGTIVSHVNIIDDCRLMGF